MFIGQTVYQIFTPAANDVILKSQSQTLHYDEYRAELLKEVRRWFWDIFHKNKGHWHYYKFINGQITDTETRRTWRCDSYGIRTTGGITMALPTYDRTKRRSSFEQLPKGAYVIRITGAKEETWPDSGDSVLRIAFDIAEGEYAGFYQRQFDANTDANRKWPMDGVFSLDIPTDSSPEYKWTNWNTFFADLEDSNAGFKFTGDLKKLKGKIVGGLFHNRQTVSKKDGRVFDHIVMKWSRTAEDIRSGRPIRLPNDILKTGTASGTASVTADSDGFMEIPEGADDELPF